MAPALPESRRDLPEPLQHVVLKPSDLDDKSIRILAVLGQAPHHRAEQRLREARGAVERLFDRELPRAFRPLNLSPQLIE
jgi:hypothetical protein